MTSVVAIGLALLGTFRVHAASDAWTGSADATWANTNNWATLPLVVPGTGDDATFNAASSFTTIDLGGGVTISNLLFDSSAAAYTIGSGAMGSQTLTLDNAGAIAVKSSVANNQLINATISLPTVANGTAKIENGSASTLTIAGAVNSVPAAGNSLLLVTNVGGVSVSGAVTETGAGNNALLKTGTGTLTLLTNSTWSGSGAIGYVPTSAGYPLVAREGTLLLAGGTNTVNGELVIGGVVANGGAGQNAKVQVDNSRLVVTSWLSVGRGNGIGGVTSDLEVNNGSIDTVNMSAGFQAAAGNRPRGTITLNGNSTLDINGFFNLGESSGSDMTLILNGTSTLTNRQNVNNDRTRISTSGKAKLVLNDASLLAIERDFNVCWDASGDTNGATVVVNGGTLSVAGAVSTTERWLHFKRSGNAPTDLVVSNGTVKLNNQTDLRYATTATATGTNTVTVVGGSIIGYSDQGTTVGGNVQIDMQRAGAAATYNVFNLDGGMVQVRDIISTATTGTRIWNFNGGTLRPNANSGNFLNLGAGTVRANVRDGGAIIDTAGFDVSVVSLLDHSDILGDAATDGGLTMTGAGKLTLSGGYTYTGPTVVNAGTLGLNASLASGSGDLSVNNAALDLNLNNGGFSIFPVNVSFAGSNSLNLAYGSVSGTPATAISASGALSASGVTTINVSGTGIGLGVIPLISFGSGAATTNGFVLGTLPSGVTAVLTNNTANTLDLLVTAAGQLLAWNGHDGDFVTPRPDWDIGVSSNWFNQLTFTPGAQYLEFGAVGDNVLFDDNGSLVTNINLTTTVKPATMVVSSTFLPYSVTGAGSIAGGVTLVKTNGGSLFLGTSNSYTGGTIISGDGFGNGSLVVTNDNALGDPAGNVTLDGTTLQLNGVISARTVNLPGNASIGVITNASSTLSGTIAGSGGLTKVDDGTLAFSGTNTYTGSTIVKLGTLAVTGTLGTTNTDIALGPDFADVGTLQVSGSANVAANRVIIGGNSANAGAPGVGVLTQSGGVINSRQWFTVGSGMNGGSSGAGTYNFSGGILNIHSQRMEVGNFTATDGTVNMSGSAALNVWNNQFITLGANPDANSGTFNQNGGTVTFYGDAGLTPGGNGVLSIGGNGTLSGTFTYNLNGGTLRVPQVQGNPANAATRVFNFNGGTLQAAKANPTFLFGLTAANVLAGGAVIETLSNNITISQALLNGGGGLTKLGEGTLSLTGSNTYAGDTVIAGGMLSLSPAHQNTNTAVVVSDATILRIQADGNNVTRVGGLTAGSILADNAEINLLLPTGTNPVSAILECGALTLNGTLNIRMGGLLNPGTFPVIKYTGAIAGGGTLNTTALVPHGYSGVVSNDVASSTIYITLSGAGGIVWRGDNTDPALTNLWDIGVTNWLSGLSPSDYLEGDKVIFDDGGNATVLLSNSVTPGGMVITNNSVSYAMSGPGSIVGVGGLTKDGSAPASLTFSGNTFSGATVINDGSLNIAGGGVIGDASAVTLADAATASLTVSGNETIGSLSGGGSSGGNVSIANDLIINGSSSTTYGGALSGSGRLRVQGVGTTTVTGSVDVGGEIWVGGGSSASIRTLEIPTGATVASGNWWVVGRDGSQGTVNINGGTLRHYGGGNLTVASLGTTPTGTINLNSGLITNEAGGTFIGENNNSVANYNQSGGVAHLGTFLRVGNGSGQGNANISAGTLNVGEFEVARGDNNTRTGTNTITIGAGATVNANSLVRLGYAGSATKLGVITNNGTLNVNGGQLYMGFWDPSGSEFDQEAGNLKLNNNTSIRFAEQGNSSGTHVFNHNGGDVTFYSDAGTTMGGTGSLNLMVAGTGSGTYNLNGGTLTVPQVVKGAGAGSGTINLNGGTLKPTASSTTFLQGLTAANVRTGGAIFDTAGFDIHVGQDLLNNFIDEDGGVTKNGAGALYLNGANTYTNTTTVNAGTLGGTGTILGPVVVTSSAALAPGASIGTLTISSDLTLAGDLAIEVNTSVSPSNDLCVVTGTATYTGSGKSVVVTNQGPALVVGDAFKLFSGTLANGQNMTITGVAGVTWTNELATLGQIRVLTVAPTVPTTPTNISFYVTNGTDLHLEWPSNYLGWSLQWQTNSRSVGLSNNWLFVPGSETITSTNIPLNKVDPTVFFRLALTNVP